MLSLSGLVTACFLSGRIYEELRRLARQQAYKSKKWQRQYEVAINGVVGVMTTICLFYFH